MSEENFKAIMAARAAQEEEKQRYLKKTKDLVVSNLEADARYQEIMSIVNGEGIKAALQAIWEMWDPHIEFVGTGLYGSGTKENPVGFHDKYISINSRGLKSLDYLLDENSDLDIKKLVGDILSQGLDIRLITELGQHHKSGEYIDDNFCINFSIDQLTGKLVIKAVPLSRGEHREVLSHKPGVLFDPNGEVFFDSISDLFVAIADSVVNGRKKVFYFPR